MNIMTLCVVCLIFVNGLSAGLFGHLHSKLNGNRHQNSFLPAPPGHTPPCARDGATFCERVETYPRDAVEHLLLKYGHTYSLFITSESLQDFMPQAPAKRDYGYGGHGPASANTGYDTTFVHNYNSSYGRSISQPMPQIPQESYEYHTLNNHQMAAVVPFIHSMWWNPTERSRRTKFSIPIGQHQRRIQKRQATENQLCQANMRFVTPEAAMNNEGDWMYIVNMPDNPRYAQQVRIETCASAGSDCNGVCQVPPGHRATCRQKYTQKRLVALDGSGSTLRNGVFWIPLCCFCEIQRI